MKGEIMGYVYWEDATKEEVEEVKNHPRVYAGKNGVWYCKHEPYGNSRVIRNAYGKTQIRWGNIGPKHPMDI
jgi:hypothetical protein